MAEANTETWVDFRVEDSLESAEPSWEGSGCWVDLRGEDEDYATYEDEYEESGGSRKIFRQAVASDTLTSWVSIKNEDDRESEEPEMNETKSYCASGQRLDCGRQNNSKWPMIDHYR